MQRHSPRQPQAPHRITLRQHLTLRMSLPLPLEVLQSTAFGAKRFPIVNASGVEGRSLAGGHLVQN
jgi:hypothetical protein